MFVLVKQVDQDCSLEILTQHVESLSVHFLDLLSEYLRGYISFDLLCGCDKVVLYREGLICEEHSSRPFHPIEFVCITQVHNVFHNCVVNGLTATHLFIEDLAFLVTRCTKINIL